MAEKFTPNYELGEQYLHKAVRHGMELWYDESSPTQDWGEGVTNDSNERSFTKFVADRVEGKLGEAAFKQMLHKEFGIQAKIDWSVYGQIDLTDEADLKSLIQEGNSYPPAESFDVKKTKPDNLWLAVRESIWKDHNKSDPFILVLLELPQRIKLDRWDNKKEYPGNDPVLEQTLTDWGNDHLPIEAEIAGWVEKQEFTHRFERGGRLHLPWNSDRQIGPPLKTNNRGIPVNDLHSSPEKWNELINRIVGDNSIDWKSI